MDICVMTGGGSGMGLAAAGYMDKKRSFWRAVSWRSWNGPRRNSENWDLPFL